VSGLAEAVGTDASTVALGWCKRRGLGGRVACGDFTAPPFQDRTFDVVMLLDVLEHLDDDREALKNAFRLLHRGGLLVVTVPAYPILWSGEDYVSEHRRRYVRRDLQELVAAAGFTVQRSSYFNTILFPVMAATIFWRRCFVPGDRTRSNVRPLPGAVNMILTAVFTLERSLLRWMSFPFGGSILCVAVKKEPA
jgi:SAM-dependent methyltransferase